MASQGQDLRSVVEVASCPALDQQHSAPQRHFPEEPIYAIPISTTSAINIHMLFDQKHGKPPASSSQYKPTEKNASVVRVDTGGSPQSASQPMVTANGPSSTQVPNSLPQVTANGVGSYGSSRPSHSRSLSDAVSSSPPPVSVKPLTKTGSLDSSTPPPPVKSKPSQPPPPPLAPSPPPAVSAVIQSNKLQVSPKPTPKQESNKPKTDIITELKARQELLKAYYSKPEVPKQEPRTSPRVSPEPKDMIRSESEADSESATWTSLEDSHSEMSSNASSAGFENDSACSLTGSEDREDAVSLDRVALVTDSSTAVFLQFSCDDQTLKNNKFVAMVTEIANACLNYFSRKESSKLNSSHVGQLVMPDRRPVAEHLQEAEKQFSDSVAITRAKCLRTKDRAFLGFQVHDKMAVRGRCTVGRSAVAVVLKKINRIAPAEEFSEQLCQHILKARPTQMGSRANLDIQLEKERKSRRDKMTMPDTNLLGQTFVPDPTITVWEAAKRSFVDIEEFLLV